MSAQQVLLVRIAAHLLRTSSVNDRATGDAVVLLWGAATR